MENITINKIHIKGWKSIKDAEVNLGKINILIGANGSGKSSFLSIFDLLRAITNKNDLIFFSAVNGGADALLHYGIKNTKEINVSITINEKTYRFALSPDINGNLFVNPSSYGYSKSAEYIDDTGGVTESESAYCRKTDDKTEEKEIAEGFPTFILYHFFDTGCGSRMKSVCDADENRCLFPDGANLAAVLYKIKNESPKRYEKIIFIINLIFPEFKDFVFDINNNYITLRWQDKFSIDTTFRLSALSDGTLRFAALTVLLTQPNPPKVIIIDEPELGLHPEAIITLSEMIIKASAKSQIIISTQSADLISCFEPENILIAEKRSGETAISRPDKEELEKWLDDYTLGQVWQKNIIGGNP